MTDQDIITLSAAIVANFDTDCGIYWRDIDGNVFKVLGIRLNYKEADDEIGEPVAVLTGNKTAALYNCELADFVQLTPLA